MRFAIVLAKLLCGLITAGILTAFIYFSTDQSTSTGLSPALICILLLTATLMIWALISMAGDAMRYRIDSKTIKEALGNARHSPMFDSAQTAGNIDFSELLAQINEANQQTLAPNFQNINEQLSMFSSKNNAIGEQIAAAVTALSEKLLHGNSTSTGAETVLTDSSDISASLSQLHTEINDLRTQTLSSLENLNAQLTQMMQNIGSVSTLSTPPTAQSVYSHVTEEANYPESVIDYTQNQQPEPEETIGIETSEINDVPLEDFLNDEPIEEEQPADNPENTADTETSLSDVEEPTVRSPSENEDSGSQDNIAEEYSDNISASAETTDDYSAEIPEETIDTTFEEPTAEAAPQDDLGAADPFGAPVDSDEPVEAPIAEAAPQDDLGAADPFGAPVDLNEPVEAPIAEAAPQDDLGAADPFGAPVDLNEPFEAPIVEAAPQDDLGAADPFGAPVDLDEPFEAPIAEAAPQDDLGAADPFGAPVDLSGTSETPIIEPEQDTLGAANPFGAPMGNIAEQYEVPTVEPEQNNDLGATDPFGTPIGLRSPYDERDNDDAPMNIGADDPFGTPTDFADPFAISESENNDTLGADDPFGSANSVNISSIEPSINNKNEPNLDQIFNDKLASELASLEIMQDTPASSQDSKNTDDIELEQFFASRR